MDYKKIALGTILKKALRLPEEILRFSDRILPKDFANLLVHEGGGRYVKTIYPEDGYEEGEYSYSDLEWLFISYLTNFILILEYLGEDAELPFEREELTSEEYVYAREIMEVMK